MIPRDYRLRLIWIALFGIAGGLALAGATFLLGRAMRRPPTLHGAELHPLRPAVNFELRAADGRVYTLGEFRDKQLVLLYFAHTTCDRRCDEMLSKLAAARQALGSRSSAVQVLVVSADPQGDPPPRFARYVQGFDPSFLGLAGALRETRDLALSYEVLLTDVPGQVGGPGGVEVSHQAALIDRQGQFRAIYPAAMASEDIAADLEVLLSE